HRLSSYNYTKIKPEQTQRISKSMETNNVTSTEHSIAFSEEIDSTSAANVEHSASLKTRFFSSRICRAFGLTFGYAFLSFFVILCFCFAIYVVVAFLLKPINQWQSVEYFGATSYGAAFIGIH